MRFSNFGDLTATGSNHLVMASSTRGVIDGGDVNNPAGTDIPVNTVDYITMSSTGNSVDFGDANDAINASCGSSPTRGIINGSHKEEDPGGLHQVQILLNILLYHH